MIWKNQSFDTAEKYQFVFWKLKLKSVLCCAHKKSLSFGWLNGMLWARVSPLHESLAIVGFLESLKSKSLTVVWPPRISVVLSLFCWLYTVQLTKWLWHDKITQLIGLSFVICIEKLCEPNLVLSKICYQQKYNVAVIPKLGITNFKAIHHRDKLADYLSHKMLVCATPHTFDECSTAVKKYSSGSFKWL